MVKICASSLFIFLLASLQAATSKITHESMWLMKRVGAPVASPDGKWVVFPVVEPSYTETNQVSDLWIAPIDGSAKPRRLTSSKGVETGVAWSPDSRRLAFSGLRDGDDVSQIYILDIAQGGEAIRITSLSTGAQNPVWRPDGEALLFNSSVYPGAADEEANKRIAAERKARKYNARVYDGFPIRYWDRWLDDRQIHLFLQTLDPAAKPRDLLAGTKLVSGRGFAGTQTDSSEELRAAWAPDGQTIVFAASTNRNMAAHSLTNADLFQTSSAGGEPKQLTSGGDSYGRPVFRPDGKALYSLYNKKTAKNYSLNGIAMFSWPSPKEPTIVTRSFDRSVTTYGITPDSRLIYLLAEDAGHEKLFQIPAEGGDSRAAMEMSQGVYTNLSVASRAASVTIVANWESATNPAEVVRMDTGGRRHHALTRFNAEAAVAIDWQPLRHFWFTSSRGKKIHNLIALPPNFDEKQKYPLFVLIHGGAANMWRDQFFTRWNYHLLASPGYVVLLTNYTGSTGFGEKFSQDIVGDPLAGPGEEINQAADEAIRQFPFIDGNRQAAGGASYGGHLTNWLQATTTRYKCLISHAGLINLESQWGTSDGIYHREIANGGPVWEQGSVWREQNPIRRAKNFRTPILLTVGENDFRVPMNQTLENWSVLQRLQVPSRLLVFPQENHWIAKGEDSRFFYQEVHAWLKKYL